MVSTSRPKQALHVCLKCGKKFRSQSPANRICPRCSSVNSQYGNISEKVLSGQRGVKRLNGEILLPPTDVPKV